VRVHTATLLSDGTVLVGGHSGRRPNMVVYDTAERFSPQARRFETSGTLGIARHKRRYRDYAVSRELIHWESQSSTCADRETGQRYQRHEALGTSIMLFARLRSDDRRSDSSGRGTT